MAPWWRQRWATTAALVAGATALVCAHVAPHFGGWSTISNGLDWDQFEAHGEMARQSVLQYGQLPFLATYSCGGGPLLANPQVDLLSLWSLVNLVAGPQVAIRVSVVGHLVLAMLAMWLWARRRGLVGVPAVGAAVVFGLSGFFAAHIGWGHQWALPFAYLPLVMLCYEAARRSLWAALGIGGLVAIMLLEGGVYPVAMTILVLCLRVLLDVIRQPRQALHLALVGGIAGAVAVGLSAPKSLPLFAYISQYPRTIHKRDALLLSHVVEMFLGRDTAKKAAGWAFNRYEYFNYLGPVVLLAVAWGAWRSRREPLRELLILMGCVGLIMIGMHGPWSPYEWLIKLPIFEQLRVSSRHTVVLGLLMALVFGYWLQALDAWLAPRWRWRHRWAVVALPVLLFVGDALVVNRGHWPHNAFNQPMPARVHKDFVWLTGGGATSYRRLLRNEGSRDCFEGITIPRANGLRVDTPVFAWLEDPAAGQVTTERWSPNAWWFKADARTPTRVVVNLNCLKGFAVRAPFAVETGCVDGLLAFAIPAGTHRPQLRYVAPLFVEGVGVFATTAAVLAGLWLRRFVRRYRRHGGPVQAK